VRFVGAVLGPINSDERALLFHIFQDIEKYLGKGKVREIIESLTLDRGYWGGHFLWKLKNRWGVDFVTLTKDDDLDFVKHVEYYLTEITKKLHFFQSLDNSNIFQYSA